MQHNIPGEAFSPLWPKVYLPSNRYLETPPAFQTLCSKGNWEIVHWKDGIWSTSIFKAWFCWTGQFFWGSTYFHLYRPTASSVQDGKAVAILHHSQKFSKGDFEGCEVKVTVSWHSWLFAEQGILGIEKKLGALSPWLLSASHLRRLESIYKYTVMSTLACQRKQIISFSRFSNHIL